MTSVRNLLQASAASEHTWVIWRLLLLCFQSSSAAAQDICAGVAPERCVGVVEQSELLIIGLCCLLFLPVPPNAVSAQADGSCIK